MVRVGWVWRGGGSGVLPGRGKLVCVALQWKAAGSQVTGVG